MKVNFSFLKGNGGGTATAPAPRVTPSPVEPVRNAQEPNLGEITPEQAITHVVDRMQAIANQLAEETAKAFGEVDSHLCQSLENEGNALRKAVLKLMEEQSRRYSLPGSGPEDNKGKRVNIAYVANFLNTGKWHRDAGFEYEIYKNTRGVRVPGTEVDGAMRQDMQAEPDSSAGYFIPAQQSSDWIDKLRAMPIVTSLGATVIESINSGFPFHIPRVTTDTVASWGGETITIPTTDMGTGRLSLTPRSLRAASIVTNLALEHSAVALDTLLRMNHEEQLALGLDLGALNGNGGTQPRGVIQTSGVNTVAFTGTGIKMGYSKAQEFLYKLRTSNAYRGRLGWALHPDVLFHAQIAGNEGDPTAAGAIDIERRLLTASPITNMAGHPFQTSTQMPTGATAVSGGTNGSAIFGAWQDLILMVFKGVTVDIERGGKTLMLDDEVLVRTLMRADIGLRHKTSFVIATGYNAS